MKKKNVIKLIGICLVFFLIVILFFWKFVFTYPHLELDKYLLMGTPVQTIKKDPSFFGDGIEIREVKVFFPKKVQGILEEKEGWHHGKKDNILSFLDSSERYKKVKEHWVAGEDQDMYWYFLNRSHYGEDDEHTGNWTLYYYNGKNGIYTRFLYDS